MAGDGSWNHLATMIESTVELDSTGICICEMDGGLLYVNRPFIEIFDRGKNDRQSFKKISDISEVFTEIFALVKKEKAIRNRELTITTESKSTRFLSCTACIHDGDGDGKSAVVIIIHDINGIKNRDTDDRWQAVLDSLEDGYYECDLDGVFINVNSAFNRITEYSRNEIIGKDYKIYYAPEEAEKTYRVYHDVFANRNPSGLISSTITAKSGRIKKIESSISLINDVAGRINGFRGIIRDVSEKSRMEKELLRARKLEAIGILAGGIAHDYNNALTAILGNISLAKMEVGPDNNSLLEVLNDAEEASLKAVELTRHLGTFARGGKPEREVINYKDSLRIIVDNVLSGYSGTYELVVQDELWSVDIDEFQINQVITYILNNAVESMAPPGIVRILAENTMVENEESHHEITLQPGKYVRISIRDEGIGIPAEDIHNIFDPYFTTKEMSSGMGLATSYAIIKRHHGYIDVKSSSGKGSTFFVYLPVAQ